MNLDTNFSALASTAFHNQKSASVVVSDTLRQAILRGQFSPGQLMPQEEIAKQFGVSRAPVRDALRQLEAEGLIVMHPHRGAEVAKLSAEDVEEVFLIRESLETTALRLSVPKMTEADFARAQSVLDRMDADVDTAHMAELNWAFHESLYHASGMARLLGMIRTLNNNALPYHHLGFVAVDIKQISQLGHREILKACMERRVETAVQALIKHLRENGNLIVGHLREQRPTNVTSVNGSIYR
ncbi:MAG: GntR family transcriptional regulator [Acidobacteria bacterium]|nr:GntR family transcriptional regulator [Acidobacteriota bacterium]